MLFRKIEKPDTKVIVLREIEEFSNKLIRSEMLDALSRHAVKQHLEEKRQQINFEARR
jgi:hypothetical protein